MYKFGTKSKARMEGVDPLLIECATIALSKSRYDMTIPWAGGLRTAALQNELHLGKHSADGKSSSKCDGYDDKSYHQSGFALDVIPVGNKPYENTRHMNHFSNLMSNVWQGFLIEGKTTKRMTWGGTFGRKGWDKPHYEIK